jgi:hypothetical protein
MCCVATFLEELWEEGERGVESRGLVPLNGATLPTHTVNKIYSAPTACAAREEGEGGVESRGLSPLNGAVLPTHTVNKISSAPTVCAA